MTPSFSASRPLPPLLLLLVVVVLPQVALGYGGGFFGRPAQETAVSSSGDAIVFGVREQDSQQIVELQVSVDFQGGQDNGDNGDNEFAWILPVPAVPTVVEVGSPLLFHALFQETLPKFELSIDNEGTLSVDTTTSTITAGSTATVTSKQGGTTTSTSMSGTCDDPSVLEQNCPSNEGPFRGGGGDGSVTVWADGQAGFLDWTVVEGTKNDLLDWLINNDYALPQDPSALEQVLQAYDEEHSTGSSVYVVLKVAPETPAGSIQPLRLEYPLPSTSTTTNEEQSTPPNVHKVPTRLSGLTASGSAGVTNRTLQVYFLSSQANTRAIPVNYLDVTLNDAHVDWVGCLNDPDQSTEMCYYQDYIQRYAQAIAEADDHSLITEYNGPSDILHGKIAMFDRNGNLNTAVLESAENWLLYLLALEAASIPPIAPVHAILDKYLPPHSFKIETPFQCARWEHLYQPNQTSGPSMEDCYSIFSPPPNDYYDFEWTWDPVGLTQELEQFILAPSRAAQVSMDTHYQSLTRLYGQVKSQSNMEPYFVVTTDKPTVDRVHRATAVPVCDLDMPNALEITLQTHDSSDSEVVTTFWQPAILTCPTWQKTSPRAVFSRDEAQPRIILSWAQEFRAWGLARDEGVQVRPSLSDDSANNGGSGSIFLSNDIDAALAYGNNLLTNLTALRPSTDGDKNVVILDHDPMGLDAGMSISSASTAATTVSTLMIVVTALSLLLC